MVSYLPEFFILFFLIIFSALISVSEVAFFSINTKAISQPEFIEKSSREFGSQCIVVSIDAIIENEDYSYLVLY